MISECILIHYHEIGLKGDNRSWFERMFIKNIHAQISGLPYTKIQIKAARIFILGIDSTKYAEYNTRLHNVMGLKHAYLMSLVNLNEHDICLEVEKQIASLEFETFRITTKRQDKNFHLTSQEINQKIGERVVEITSRKVNLDKPELNIIIDYILR